MSLPIKVWLLSQACARFERLAPGESPGRTDIVLLALAWGNPGYAAGVSYLRHVGERVKCTRGTVLECGSGATTLLIAAMTAGRRIEFIVLEHDRQWYEYLSVVLARLGFGHVRLINARLRDFGGYRWYDVSGGRVTGEIGLVVCDGPPGSTPGGRYGLMPVMGSQLARNCVILLDDTHREDERRIIDVWRRHRCLKANRLGHFGTHTELVFC